MASDSSIARGVDHIRTPVCLVLGMAGSGKTTLVDALSSWLEDEEGISDALLSLTVDESKLSEATGETNTVSSSNTKGQNAESTFQTSALLKGDDTQYKTLEGKGCYVLNLDPAVLELPYEPNIDIRDTINYKDVMKEYTLGPNGAIITSLNLYATRFDQVLSLVEKRAPDTKAVIVDTPGQIETFTWSASGAIITEALGMVLPTVILFVVDTKRCESAMTFVSNMLYACSIMYKTRLPMVVAFNKIDVVNCKFAQTWMEDFDAFDAALKEENFVGTLARSMAMALEEFYKTMRSVGVSAETSEGMSELVNCIQDAAMEYETEYRPVVEERKRQRAKAKEEKAEKDLERFKKDAADEIQGKREVYDEDYDGGSDRIYSKDGKASKPGVRLSKLKGTHYDDEEEQKDYEEFERRWGMKKEQW